MLTLIIYQTVAPHMILLKEDLPKAEKKLSNNIMMFTLGKIYFYTSYI